MPVLHCGDAFEVMRDMPDKSVDHIITDPPYGTTRIKWDQPIDWARYWTEARRITRPNANHVMFASQPFTSDLVYSARQLFRYALVWPKTSVSGFLDAAHKPLRTHEDVLVFGDGRGTYNPIMASGDPYTIIRTHESAAYGKQTTNSSVNSGERYPTSLLPKTPRGQETVHPTEKPTDLMSYLVLTYSDVGDVVLDPFMGSGSTGVSSMRENRGFIGIELDAAYYAVAEKRIRAAHDQPRLLAPEMKR